jgi:hypothetical protein
MQQTRVRLSPPQFAFTTAVLGVLAFWGAMVLAARRFPSEYDWRYMTISMLVYTDRNPGGYLWARAGVVACGVAGLIWTMLLAQKERRAGSAQRPTGIWALGLGYLCMALCALLPDQLVAIPKSHELLALAAFFAICVGIVHTTFKAIERSAVPGPQLGAGFLALVPLSPIVLAALALAYVSHARPDLPWVNLTWRSRGVPAYLSFAFWEWITCAVFSVYMLLLSRTTLAGRR